MNEFVSAFSRGEIARLLIDVGVKGFVIVALASGLYMIVRRRSAALRHLVLTLSCMGLVSLPWLSASLPALHVPLGFFRPGETTQPDGTTVETFHLDPPDALLRDDMFESEALAQHDLTPKLVPADAAPSVASCPLPAPSNQSEPVPTRRATNRWANFLPIAWLLGAALSLLMPLVGLLGIARICCSSGPIKDKAWLELLHKLKIELGISRRVSLLRSPNIESALTCGVFTPKLLLPAAADEWSDSQRRTVLLHELAHIQRFDWAIQMISHLASAIHWFNPLVWWMSRRMYLDREQASDDIVLSVGIDPTDYASQLVQIATRIRPLQSLAAIPMAQQSTLRQRVNAVLDSQRPRGSIGRISLSVAIVVCCCVVVPVGMLKATDGPAEKDRSRSTDNTPVESEEPREGIAEATSRDEPKANVPKADAPKVYVVDVTPDEAAAYLGNKKGIRVHKTKYGYYPDVTLKRDWIVDPKDWLYIANLAREIKGTPNASGKRHPIHISIDGPVEPDVLVECFKCFRKSKSDPFGLFLFEAPLKRESLRVLGSYPGLTGLHANEAIDDITDEDWAACVSAWPNANTLFLNPNGGRKAIAAASKLEHLRILRFRNTKMTEADLKPFRKNLKLEVLSIWDGKKYVEYLNQNGNGKWQSGDAVNIQAAKETLQPGENPSWQINSPLNKRNLDKILANRGKFTASDLEKIVGPATSSTEFDGRLAGLSRMMWEDVSRIEVTFREQVVAKVAGTFSPRLHSQVINKDILEQLHAGMTYNDVYINFFLGCRAQIRQDSDSGTITHIFEQYNRFYVNLKDGKVSSATQVEFQNRDGPPVKRQREMARARANAAEPKRLQGDWTYVSREDDGEVVEYKDWTLSVSGNRWQEKYKNQVAHEGTFVIDDAMSAPKKLTIHLTRGLGSPGGAATGFAIYAIRDDTLTYCVWLISDDTLPSNKNLLGPVDDSSVRLRPKTFDTKGTKSRTTFTLTRKKRD